MDKGKGIAVEREEGETNDTLVSSAVVCDDIVNLLDFYERMKNGEQDAPDSDEQDRIEKRIVTLTILLRIVQFCNPNLDDIKARSSYEIQSEEDAAPVYLRLVDYIKSCVCLGHHSKSKATVPQSSYEIQSEDDAKHVFLGLFDYVKSRVCLEHHSKWTATMTEEELVELLDSIVIKLHVLSPVESIFPFVSQHKTLQNVCCLIRDFHALKVNGCIEPEIVEFVIPQLQLMDERVAHFCWVLLADQLNKFAYRSDKKLRCPRVDVALAHTLEKIIPIGLEVMHTCFANLRALNLPRVEHFIKQVVKVSPDILIHLRYRMIH